MLTCFNLVDGATIDDFDTLLRRFTSDLADQELVASTGPVGRRHRYPVMDTDAERDHEFFFLMNFNSLTQCDEAVARFQSGNPRTEQDHLDMQSMIADAVFICWQDVAAK